MLGVCALLLWLLHLLFVGALQAPVALQGAELFQAC